MLTVDKVHFNPVLYFYEGRSCLLVVRLEIECSKIGLVL